MFSIAKNNPKSLSAGSTTRVGGGKVSQSPVRKKGPCTKVRPASASTPKAVEPARPSKAPDRPKPLVASKVLNNAQSPGAVKPIAAWKPLSIIKRSTPKATAAPAPATSKVPDAEAIDVPKAPPSLKASDVIRTYAAVVAACKPLNIVKRSSAPKAAKTAKTAKAPDLFKSPTASKVLDTLGAGDAPKATPAPKAADALKTSSTRATAVEAVRRQISEQKQKAAAVTARKAKAKSEPTLPLPAKPKVATATRDATPPSASASRPKAEGITATAKAAENAPSPGIPSRRPLPAVRKGGVRKELAVVSKASSPNSPPVAHAHAGGCCSRHKRNSLSAAVHLSERASLTRKNAIRKRYPVVKPRTSAPVSVVPRSSSAPLLGWAKVAGAVPRSTSGPLVLCEIVKPIIAQPANMDADVHPKVLRVINPDTPSDDAADCSSDVSIGTLVGSDEDASVHQPLSASPRPPISIQHFNIQSVVGQGGFGKVVRATLKGSQQTYAIKIVPKTKLRYEYGALAQMLQEQEVARSVAGEKFLAGIDASFHDVTNFYLVMDYHPMSLFDYWNNHARPPPTLIRLWSAEVACGLNALHKRGIMHRDVKLENILLGADGHARVADYGLARRFEAPAATPRVLAVYVDGRRVATPVRRPMTAGVMGTLAYMAPEMLCELRYSYAVDWWAWGVLLYALCFGQFPWDHEDYDEMKRLVHTPVPLPDWAWTFDPELVAMINMALEKNPADRITFNGIQAMPFFLAIDWDAVAVTSIRLPAPRAKPINPTISSTSSTSSTLSLLSNDIRTALSHDAHPQFTWMSPAFAAAKVPADIILADEDLVRDTIVSLDGEAPVFDTPAAWKAAFESAESLGGSATLAGSSVSSHKKTVAPVVAKAAKGVKKWWKRVVGRKECRRA